MEKLSSLIKDKGLDKSTMPTAPNFLSKSFLFLRSTENVNSPGELVAELFRETFYKKHYDARRVEGSRLDPMCNDLSEGYYTVGEKAILEVFRGNLKRNNKASYIPSYPHLMRNAWLRQKGGRIIKNHFISGALAQGLWVPDHNKFIESIENFAELYYEACIGSKSTGNNDKSELLDAIRAYDALDDEKIMLNAKFVSEKIKDCILDPNKDSEIPEEKNKQIYTYPSVDNVLWKEFDKLPNQIYQDFVRILEFEKVIPRIEWIFLLSNYLRVAVPSWVFATSKFTIILYDILIKIIDSNEIPQENDFYRICFERNYGLFICSETANPGGEDIVVDYGKKRVLLSLLLYIFQDHFQDQGIMEKTIDLNNSYLKDAIGMYDFLKFVKEHRESLLKKINPYSTSMDSFLRRNAESYSIFRDPKKSGITKNIFELLRVLREPENGFDSGGLLKPNKRGSFIDGYFVFPQPSLLRLFVFLSTSPDKRNGTTVQELINHLGIYGIDFSKSNEARMKLKLELMHLGLLKGSPDAGMEAIISSPY